MQGARRARIDPQPHLFNRGKSRRWSRYCD